jgi:predicted translin family RNA/ssDNA-binding protein
VRTARYLSGVMSVCQELVRYAVGQATHGHAGSVLLCKELVDAVHAKLIEFDFRNGPLRRKFDGIK